MPNIMLEKGLSCKGCHIFHEETGGRIIKSETFISKARACESCHGRGFSRILKDWEISTEKKLTEIKVIYTRVRQEIVQTKKPDKEKAKSLLDEAAFNIDIVERGKSVHNMTYSQELLRASYDNLLDVLRLISSSYKPKTFLASAKEVPTLCSNCHAGIEEINTQIFGLDFPHKRHLVEQKIQCSTCHSNVRRHGEFIATKKNCAVCHHREPEKDCTICHQIQKAFYQGGQLNGQKIPEDIMFEAEVDCKGCHISPQNQIYRSDRNKCIDCHEEEYGEIFSEWQNSAKELIRYLKTFLAEKKKLSLSKEEKAQLLEIEKSLENIELDGSSGIHNYLTIEEMLTNFKNSLQSLGKNSGNE